MKHQEHIMAFENERFSKIFPMVEGFNRATTKNTNTFFKDTLPALVFTQRLELDDSSSDKKHTHKQILPYVLLTKSYNNETYYMVYQRGKGVGESRLAGNMSIGLGGHVDITDCQSSDGVVNLSLTIRENVIRELMEETMSLDRDEEYDSGVFEDMLDDSAVHGFINDTSNHVGRDHLGVVISIDCTHHMLTIREAELKEIGWYTKQELLQAAMPFESWTKIIINNI